MDKVKTIIIYFVLFLFGLTIAIISEDHFHRLVRYLYEVLTKNKINFHIQKLELYFFSLPFIISVGLYSMILFYLLRKQSSNQRNVNFILTLILLSSSIPLICYIDANIKLIECTACKDGFRELNFSDISYSTILILSLLTSLIPPVWTIVNRPQPYEKT